MFKRQNPIKSADNSTLLHPSKCIWMMSGFVSYKLCDRDYDCEHFPLDRAIKENTVGQIQVETSETHKTRLRFNVTPSLMEGGPVTELLELEAFKLDMTLFYHPFHTWARVEEGGSVRIGLDDFGQKLVRRIYAVYLPQVETKTTAGRSQWRIAHRVGETSLAVPVTGTIQEVNERLGDFPSLINHEPYGQGWAMIIQPEHLREDLRSLHYGQPAKCWYNREVDRLDQELRSRFASFRPDVGTTLQDGGVQIGIPSPPAPIGLLRIIDSFLSPPLPVGSSTDPMTESESRRR